MSYKTSFSRHIILFTSTILLAIVIKQLYSLFPLSKETKLRLGFTEDSILNFTQVTTKYGYETEEHRTVTEDGYVLTIFRMRKKNCGQSTPVILMHGLLQSADSWRDAGPGQGLAYLIADQCHDLWIGNQRGNTYSNHHLQHHTNSEQFWSFSADEIGLYDIPATIDYVIKTTRHPQVNYIGFSQGAMTLCITFSEKPKYTEKVKVFLALSPAVLWQYSKSATFRNIALKLDDYRTNLRSFGVYTVFGIGGFLQEGISILAQLPFGLSKTSAIVEYLIDTYHSDSLTTDTRRSFYAHFFETASIQNMARYGQHIKHKGFTKFDFGKEENLKVYGTETPPAYNLKAVTVPTVVMYGSNDGLVDAEDVKSAAKQMPNVTEVIEVNNPNWNHLDFCNSRFVKELVFGKINEYLIKYS